MEQCFLPRQEGGGPGPSELAGSITFWLCLFLFGQAYAPGMSLASQGLGDKVSILHIIATNKVRVLIRKIKGCIHPSVWD